MRILLVAMPDSIHTARWISQIADQGWEISLYPCQVTSSVHQDMPKIDLSLSFFSARSFKRFSKIRGIPVVSERVARLLEFVGRRSQKCKAWHFRKFIKHIKSFKPDIIHSLEIQQAGYLTLEAKKYFPDKFPKWIVTNWGSDIYLFGRLKEHQPMIRKVLAECDHYSCECKRDICLAKAHGLAEGKELSVFPNSGGFDISLTQRIRQDGLTSSRRIIMLKGYQHWAGRALVGLRALERCADALTGYEIFIYSAYPDVVIAAELFTAETGIPTRIIPPGTSQHEILRHHGHARISIGLSISDAISTSLLESIVMGSFPIQSWTACADEWIQDGISGILVPPEDPEIIELAIRRALEDDTLVNNAATINQKTAAVLLDKDLIKDKTLSFYNEVYNCI
jgi:glycosyltransferase involved in cell wall biosynthesis